MKKFENIAEVLTSDLREAVIEAERLVRENPKLQGVILRRPPVDCDVDALQKKYELKSRLLGLGDGIFITQRTAEFLASEMPVNEIDRMFIPQDISMLDALDSKRKADMSVMASMFNHVRGSVVLETNNYFRPHYDGGNKEEFDESCFFGGRTVRMFHVHKGPGIQVFLNDEGIDIQGYEESSYKELRSAQKEKAIPVNEGDILLFFSTAWGHERALAHTSPEYEMPEGDYRVFDNVTLSQGKPLHEIDGYTHEI